MRIHLAQPIPAPEVVALEIPDSEIRYNPTTRQWEYQVFGVAANGDVHTLLVQSAGGVIVRLGNEHTGADEVAAYRAAVPGGESLSDIEAVMGAAQAWLAQFLADTRTPEQIAAEQNNAQPAEEGT